jgi:hypothetical protein
MGAALLMLICSSFIQKGSGAIYLELFDGETNERIIISKDDRSSSIRGIEYENGHRGEFKAGYSKTIDNGIHPAVFGPVAVRLPVYEIVVNYKSKQMVLLLDNLPDIETTNLLMDSMAFRPGVFNVDCKSTRNEFIEHPYLNRVWDITPTYLGLALKDYKK